MGVLGQLRKGLFKTSGRITEGIGRLFLGKKEVDSTISEELEEILISADIGFSATQEILEAVADGVLRKELDNREALVTTLQRKVSDMLTTPQTDSLLEDSRRPLVILVVGVNGVGKTTTIGKLGARFRQEGKSVICGAGDTFRAAAIEQLGIWAERIGADVVQHQAGADPSAVAYDAVSAAVSRNTDVVLIDTAGRLHTRDNLMGQLEKMKRVITKVIPDAPHRVLLVLDGTNGQNAISQAREFLKITGVTDIAVTKLDGTAKGGVIIPIVRDLGIPVSFVGVGETVDDLIPFDSGAFAEMLFTG